LSFVKNQILKAMSRAKNVAVAIVVALIAVATPVSLHAQGGQGRGRVAPTPGGSLAEDGVSPAEIQRLFDAYVVMQAQQELQLTDDQFPKFLARVRSLQDIRRRGQMQRGRMFQELRRLSQAPVPDEAQLRAQLKALSDLESRVQTEVRQALDGVDQVLDLRQQARFRLFEEQMERRKVDLLMRARQANRAKNQF
jgi:hypothetical protein